MEVLAEAAGKIYGAITIERPQDFVSPFPDSLFPCLIWDHAGRFSEVERAELAGLLLDAGCRYTVCAGENCESWHDAVDLEFVLRHLDDPPEAAEGAHVMTTGHEGECPDDVAFFFVFNTNFDHHDFEQYLVLHVGTGKLRALVDAAVTRYAQA